MERFRSLSEAVVLQNNHREPWSIQDPMELMDKLQGETGELREALLRDQDAIHVAGEIGDVLYMLVRLSHELGINPLDALQMKITRNGVKYNDALLMDCNPQASKDLYRWMGGDERFFQWYEKNACLLDDKKDQKDDVSYGQSPDDEAPVMVAG